MTQTNPTAETELVSKETIATLRREALNATLEAHGLTPNALARMARIDSGNLRAVVAGTKGMGHDKWLAVASACPAGAPLRALFLEDDLQQQAVSTNPGDAAGSATGIIMVPFNKLAPNPDNYRKTFDADELAALAESIFEHGILQNLVARPPVDDIYPLNSGGRRHAAIKRLVEADRLPADYPVPCLIKDISEADARALAIVENIQRQDVPVLEEAEGFRALTEMDWDTARIASTCGLSLRTVQDRLQLIERLTPPAREALATRAITLDQARAIMTTTNEDDQAALVKYATNHDYTAAALRDQAKRGKPPVSAAKFDLAEYKGEFLGEGKTRVFSDAGQFNRLQRGAAEKIAAALRDDMMPDEPTRKRFAKVTLLPEGDTFSFYHHRTVAEGTPEAEAFVWIESWSHSIKSAEGYAPDNDEDDGDDADDENAQAEHEAERVARDKKIEQVAAFKLAVQTCYITHPLDCLRMTILCGIVDECAFNYDFPQLPSLECNMSNAALRDAVCKALKLPGLFLARDSDDEIDGDSYRLPDHPSELVQLWDRLCAMTPHDVITLYATLAADMLAYSSHWTLNPFDQLFADNANIPVPDFMRADDGADEDGEAA
jgi:ParB/RepB/Spo0J family partition protein